MATRASDRNSQVDPLDYLSASDLSSASSASPVVSSKKKHNAKKNISLHKQMAARASQRNSAPLNPFEYSSTDSYDSNGDATSYRNQRRITRASHDGSKNNNGSQHEKSLRKSAPHCGNLRLNTTSTSPTMGGAHKATGRPQLPSSRTAAPDVTAAANMESLLVSSTRPTLSMSPIKTNNTADGDNVHDAGLSATDVTTTTTITTTAAAEIVVGKEGETLMPRSAIPQLLRAGSVHLNAPSYAFTRSSPVLLVTSLSPNRPSLATTSSQALNSSGTSHGTKSGRIKLIDSSDEEDSLSSSSESTGISSCTTEQSEPTK